MKTLRFNTEDLSIAGYILSCKHITDQYGVPIYKDEFIEWAREVMRYFGKLAWETAKETCNLKKAWATIKKAAQTISNAIFAPTLMTGRKLRKSILMAIPNGFKPKESIKIRQYNR